MNAVPAIRWDDPSLVLLQRREIGKVVREVYRRGEEEIIKRYRMEGAGRHDRRKVWVREHRALERLRGLSVPVSGGFVRTRTPDGWEVTARREFIPGSPLDELDGSDLDAAAVLIADMHARGVVTSDLNLRNFLQGEDGRIWFLDFGRARVFRWRSPLLWTYIGRDLARFSRSGLRNDQARWARFWPVYAARAAGHGLPVPLLRWCVRWYGRRYSRPYGEGR